MSEIHESCDIPCPFEDVPLAAEHFLSTLPSENGKRVIELHVTVGDLSISRKADLELSSSRAFPTVKVMEIAWHRTTADPTRPSRERSASKRSTASSRDSISMERMLPLLGLAGLAFDAVLGHRLAAEAVRNSWLRSSSVSSWLKWGMTVPAP